MNPDLGEHMTQVKHLIRDRDSRFTTAFDALFETESIQILRSPVRAPQATPSAYYNLTITGLSVAVALVIGSIELIGVAHDRLGFVNPLTDWISNLNLNNVGFVIVAAFVVVWAVAIAYWKIARVEHRWQDPKTDQA
jgi:hypothetical protein